MTAQKQAIIWSGNPYIWAYFFPFNILLLKYS